MPAHKIGFYLNSSAGLRSLAHDAQRLAELQQTLLKTAPESLEKYCLVKELRAGTLFLLAENAAIAAKLKQLAPRLLSAYQKQGGEVTSIRIEVQVKEPAPSASSKRQPKRLSLEAIDNLERLAASIEECPLKRALLHLAKRQRDSS
jgi:hypothetical protein